MTQEEYLNFEEASEERHEYANGVLRLMDNVTFEHNDITLNFVVQLLQTARDKGCRLRSSSVRFKVSFESQTYYYYPDITLLCGPRGDNKHLTEDPCLVVEVLSESSTRIDKGEKLETYQRIASLKQYILVDQTRRKLEIYTRGEGVWIYQMLEAGEFKVPCLDVTMTLDEVYAGLEFAAAKEQIVE
jgi:Uma2 family endonuclease